MERAGTADLVGDKEAVVNHVIRYVRITQGVDIQQVRIAKDEPGRIELAPASVVVVRHVPSALQVADVRRWLVLRVGASHIAVCVVPNHRRDPRRADPNMDAIHRAEIEDEQGQWRKKLRYRLRPH